ncbi:MarP family serine protease [Microbacterium sp.]|uniref:MarP family serine protease n=1 Tax=Microbacterium sp. TaxID=51671 RepID=UPI003A88E820
MLIVDILAVLVLAVGAAIGIARGLLATAGALIGLAIGTVAAVWVVPLVARGVADWQYRTLVLTVVAVAIVAACAALGVAAGMALRRHVDKAKLGALDRVLGGIVDTAVAGLVLLLLAGSITASGTPVLSTAVGSSRVIGMLDALTPAPVDGALAELRGFVVEEGIPQVRVLLAPQVQPTSPPITLDDPDLERAAASVARISGTAYSCGVSMTGSGFVVADDLVVTNAHVVAGVDTPVVELPARPPREGRIVYFDPDDDLAVIAVDDLGAAPLEVAEPVAAGTAVAVQGYPLGGPFHSGPGFVVSVGTAPVTDIYDDAISPRDLYALDADVRPGNSGGPVLTDDGEVVGVVFARGIDEDRRGYAMTTDELDPVLAATSSASASVSSGACTT